MLNPDQVPYCIDTSVTSASLPIRINQTNPILIELLRFDLDTNYSEIISIQAKEVRRMRKQAEKQGSHQAPPSPRVLHYPVKQTGLYRLQRVVDESKLDVQRRFSDTLVVRCPSAYIKPVPENRCMGDLSDFHLQVEATPPINVEYSKIINEEEQGHVALSIPPESPISPLAGQRISGALISKDAAATVDVSWARTQHTRIPLNESLGSLGNWKYRIDMIKDGCGNIVDYTSPDSEEKPPRQTLSTRPLGQSFTVHGRPTAALRGCDSQRSLRVPRGKSIRLPIQLSPAEPKSAGKSAHRVSYMFTPSVDVLPNQEHSKDAVLADFKLEGNGLGREVSEPGLYTLRSVESPFCAGDVLEPSSCSLTNPPEPSLSIDAHDIPDRCAGKSIGLTVDLDLTGNPPFRISYNVRRNGGAVTPQVTETHLMHTQLELKPVQSGHYRYEFLDISDAVYREPRSFGEQHLVLEQDVKPPASARFLDPYPTRKTCIGEPVALGVELLGEGPWGLNYEVVYHGRRQKHKVDGIETEIYTLTTDELKSGGEYSLALTGVTDGNGCKISLEEQVKIEVALQRPKASFGLIEGQRTVLALEDKQVKLPLRLQGESPWTVTYRKTDDPVGDPLTALFRNSNDQISVKEAGTYELVQVQDATCPGNVDRASDTFTVKWVPRPSVQVVESPAIKLVHQTHVKRDICEGDEDTVDLSFTGTPPFDVEYNHHLKPEQGSQSTSTKTFTAGISLAAVKMESIEPGLHQYLVSKLSDLSYSHSPRKFSPAAIEQRVHANPTAAFVEGGMTYRYCKEEEAGDEKVPISLKGSPPFHMEVEIRHHSSSKPELVTIPNIETHQYNLHLPRRHFALGTYAVRIRKIRDGHGCQRRMDQGAPRVQVNVAEVPSITASEAQTDYCVGDRISYTLSGSPPFNVFYTFQGQERKASASSTSFRRLAEKPGEFTITAVTDQRSAECKAHVQMVKVIHEMPSVRISKGRTATVDIHEGGQAEILFEFGGSPPFEFT